VGIESRIFGIRAPRKMRKKGAGVEMGVKEREKSWKINQDHEGIYGVNSEISCTAGELQ